MRKRYNILWCCAVFMVCTTVLFSANDIKAPHFALCDLDGNYVTLSDLLKKNNIIIAFWASYCNPCKVELPQLAALEERYNQSKQIKLIIINIDTEGKEKALPVLQELSIGALCLLDPYQIVVKKYNPDLTIPATFLVTKKGIIIFKAIGESTENIRNLELEILKL